MRKIKIVTDSSSDVPSLSGVELASTPLKIITEEREFIDNDALDIAEMVTYLEKYKGRSSSACPSPNDFLNAFGDAEEVYCVTITSGLSGCYNAAVAAKKIYEEENPTRRVLVIDSLSTGPEMALIIEKLRAFILEGKSFEEIEKGITKYKKKTGLLFMLESMKNLANNGRVSRLTAKLAGVMSIRVIGIASDKGELAPLDKPRGSKLALTRILSHLEALGYRGGKLHIAHCFNHSFANELKDKLIAKFPKAEIAVRACRGLCSFYAEKGGLLVGFEKA